MGKEIVNIYKSVKFYNAYGDSRLIIHKLMNYRFVEDKNDCCFPESALNKVENI